MWYINNKHVLYLRKTRKKSKHENGTENVVPFRNNIDCFAKTKRNPEVVSGFRKCLFLHGNRMKYDQMRRPSPVKNFFFFSI